VNYKEWFVKVEEAVKQAELKFGGGEGINKRKFAIDVINAVVDVPFIPEFIEKEIIGLLVDFCVHFYNKWFTKQWIKKLPACHV